MNLCFPIIFSPNTRRYTLSTIYYKMLDISRRTFPVGSRTLLSTSFLSVLSIILTLTVLLRYEIVLVNKKTISEEPGRGQVHLSLDSIDFISNRCIGPQSRIPCRPLLGHVRKRFRPGMTPRAKQVAISDAYKFVYIKLPKTAGTTVHYGYLHTALCPIRNENDSKVHHYFDKAKSAPIRANCPEELLYPSLDRGQMPGGIGTVKVEKLYHYFVFTVVRNPWKRAVSAYEYCSLDMVGSFREFSKAPQTFGSSCTKNKTALVNVTYPNYHWHLQTPELCDLSGKNCLVDYVVDLDRLPEMMDEVIDIINSRRNESLPALPKFSDVALELNRNKRSTKEIADYGRYYKDCPECIDFIGDFYREDVSMFGYDFPYKR